MRSPLKSLPCRLCVAICLLLAAQINAFAQATTSTVADGGTPAAVAPGSPSGTLVFSNMESINLFSGHLSFHVPLITTGGRGEATAEIAFPIEQLWKIETIKDGDFTSYAPSPNWWESWQPLYGEAILEGRSIGNGDLGSQCGHQFRQTNTRLTYIAPDHTETELRDAISGGDWLNSPCFPLGQGDSRGQVFSSFDGSAASFVSDSVLYDDPGPSTSQTIQNPSGYLFLKNGSRVRMVNGIMSSFRDRNGNTMTYSYTQVSTPPNPNFDPSSVGQVYPTSVVDSIGRTINFSYMNIGTAPDGETDAHYDTVTYPGVGGTQRTIKIWWTELRPVSATTPHHFRTSSSRGLYSNPSQEAQITNPDFVLQNYQNLFPPFAGGQPMITDTTVWDPVVASAIQLPDGRLVRLWYNDYGELSAVDLPTGGRVEWDFTRGITGTIKTTYIVQHRVTERRIYKTSGDTTPVERTTYAYTDPGQSTVACPTGDTSSQTTVIHYDTSNNVLAKEIHSFCGNSKGGPASPTVDDPWDQGKEIQVDYFSGSGTTPLKTVATTWTQRVCNDNSPFPVNAPCTHFGVAYDPQASTSPLHDPRVTSFTTSLKDQSPYAVAQQYFTYDYYNNRQDVYEYDFGSGVIGSLARHTSTQYKTDGVYDVLNTANYPASTHVRDLPSTVTTYDQNNSQFAQTKYTYDNQTLVNSCLSAAGHDATYDSSVSHRGNPTQIGSWLGPLPGTFLNTTKTYDLAGNLRSVQDPKSFTTTFNYTDSSCAFVNTITNALTQVTSVVYDQSLGRPTTVTDPNNIVTAYTYGTNDPNDRLTQVTRGTNTAQTTYVYSDQFGASTVTATTDVNAFNDKLDQTVTVYDGLGRVTERRQYVPAASCGQYVTTTTFYDNLGRVSLVSNPYCFGAETASYTTTNYDGLNRVTSIRYADNSVQTSTPVNNQITVIDPANVKRTTQIDALGRLTSVTEYFTGGATPATSYLYDALDDLLAVSQGGQATCLIGQIWYSRCFNYDSLRRLTSANNPESGITGYTYDNNGNVAGKTAGGITSCFGNLAGQTCDGSGYDALNRTTFKSFSDGTPSVTWLWDTVQKGRLTSVTSTPSKTSFSSYDLLGRPTASAQATPANSPSPYNFTYAYVPAGMSSVIFPSGRVVNYTYDIAGRPLSVGGTTYASSITYASHGGIASFTLGNNKVEQTCYNNRLQPTAIRLGAAISTNCANTSGADLLNLSYNYGTTNNNGNVQTQTIARPVGTWTQTYGYDGVNRLTSGSESGTGSWSEAFGYDAFGNRWVTNPNGLPPPTNETPLGPNWFLSNNRISGWGYDGRGNLTSIPSMSRTFSYDAENRMTSATVGGASNYFYDGEGRRVQKVTSSGTTTYVYDASGQLAAEYGATTDSDIGVRFLTSDHLGSTRLKTDSTGAVTNCYDYLPFGEEIAFNTAGRTASCFAPTGTDTFNMKFTGKERDAETGLDFFRARYFPGAQGRFTGPDPENAGSDPGDPQSWNGYAYGRNNPLLFTDPTGRNYAVCDRNGNNCADLTNQQYKDYLQANPSVYQTPGGTLEYVNENGSETAIGSAQYYDETKLASNVQGAQFLYYQTGRVVNGLGIATGAVVAGAALGIAYGAYTGGSALIGLGVASGPAIFQAGQTIDRVVNTSAGPVRFVAEVETSGSQLILKDILIYPTETGDRIAVGAKEILQAAKPLLEQARQAGFSSVRFVGDRSAAAGSANPGRPVDFTRTLK